MLCSTGRSAEAREPLLQQAVDAADHGIYITDSEGVLEMVNPGFCRIAGYSREELLGKNISVLKSEKMALEYYQRLWKTILAGESWQEEIINRRKDGTLYWAFQIINPVTDKEGKITHYVGVQNDITETRRLRKERDIALGELDAIFSNTQDAIFLVDVDHAPSREDTPRKTDSRPQAVFRYRKLNPAHEELTGFTTEAVRGKSPEELLPPETARTVSRYYRICLEAGAPLTYEETLALPASTRTWQTKLAPIYREGKIVQLVGASRDITEEKTLQEKLRTLSEQDALTGIANRRKIQEELSREMTRAIRYTSPLSVIMADLDHFKAVNDTLGHDAGDSVLKAAASAMAESLRPSDHLGRWGGEEFLIVLPETDLPSATTLAERIRQHVAGLAIIPDHPVTMSLGVSTLEELCTPEELQSHSDSTHLQALQEKLLQRADSRLYLAKESGRNRVQNRDAP
ncbi:diguanylate cyclase with PAS/PAC sensor [Alkalispirochaeta americana]|uniref:Diguanylate cyclase with PAS/PAC sensor n=1 Tax=Alkalispirochaeta americana TaxID=159291 RepID=A0A1N6UCB9_9SPIO|nr:sensor domain-containing diguanylate cyclase [Alkalispirochaeta americana]SIQ63308.1 diguanylate cyclase with PAS/PAC sensor [Alkalispirochaeta americana]